MDYIINLNCKINNKIKKEKYIPETIEEYEHGHLENKTMENNKFEFTARSKNVERGGRRIMTTSEHLIENALTFYEENRKLGAHELYEKFMENKLLKKQAEFIGISMKDVWFMAQYLWCTYIPYIREKVEDEMIERYGYKVEE